MCTRQIYFMRSNLLDFANRHPVHLVSRGVRCLSDESKHNGKNSATVALCSTTDVNPVLKNTRELTDQWDYRTSVYSPLPPKNFEKRIQNNFPSEAVSSGAPLDLQTRIARIYRFSKSATQSGEWQTHSWRLDWDVLSRGNRWENPLMGWQSTSDAMQAERLSFRRKEDAIRFAERQGYRYYVQEPKVRKFTPKAYAENYYYSAGPLKQIRTK